MGNGNEPAERRRWTNDLERIAAIDSTIDEALRLLRSAVTELPLDKSARIPELLARAQSAYDRTRPLIGQVNDPEEQRRLRSKHQELEARIWDVQRRRRRHDQENS